MRVPVVEVECPEHAPAAQILHDLGERLLPVRLDVVQALAALVEVLNLPLDTVVLKYKQTMIYRQLFWISRFREWSGYPMAEYLAK